MAEGERRGTAVTILRELYRAGMRRDPEAASEMGNMVRQKYLSCPVVFTRT
jgi:hypothetical protein